ncbi:MAG: dockerin type I repeat-containing protein [Clostridia bacterium]|nr:dockerin type I repeat-containing protein [Clostridia bacterium]
MKKSTKIISLILSVVMVFSVLPVFASANAINKDVTTIEKFISNDNIANVADYLVRNINRTKDDITGTILKIVLLVMGDNESLQPYIGTQDVTTISDEARAKIVVDWLNAILKEKTEDINNNQVIKIINMIPGLTVKLDTIDHVYETLGMADKTAVRAILKQLGDLKDLKVTAVKNVTVAKNGNLGVIKAAIQFVEDNLPIIRKFILGTLDFGNYKIPIVGTDISGMLKDAVGEYIAAMKNLPLLLKSMLYKAIDSEAHGGDFDKDAAKASGDWGKSAYKAYSADELLGAALIKVIKGTEEVIPQEEAKAATSLSFYQILSQYAPDLYNRFAISWLNENLQHYIEKMSITEEIKGRFKTSIETFDENTFKEIFDGAKESGILSQVNNLIVRIAELILTPEAYTELALDKGGNDKLNGNLLKICRYVLPAMANKEVSDAVGFDFTPFTKEAVSKMELGDMLVAVLKPFMQSWFGDSPKFDNETVASVKNVRQLAALAIYYTATNTDWLNLEYDFTALGEKLLDGKTVKDIDDETAKDIITSIAAGIGIGALKYNKDAIHFNAEVDDADWKKAALQISNWALGFIKGLPAVVAVADLMNADDFGPFYKINVVLNELIDFSFLNDVNTENFKLDLETLINDAVLGNLFDCDVAGVLHIFEKNEKEGNILNAPVIPSVIGAVDRIVTALFEHTDNIIAGEEFDYDEQSGYIIPRPAGPEYKLGDVDEDGKITASDARLALRRAVDLETFEEGSAKFLACDVDKDSKVTAGDARTILRAAVGLEEIA